MINKLTLVKPASAVKPRELTPYNRYYVAYKIEERPGYSYDGVHRFLGVDAQGRWVFVNEEDQPIVSVVNLKPSQVMSIYKVQPGGKRKLLLKRKPKPAQTAM